MRFIISFFQFSNRIHHFRDHYTPQKCVNFWSKLYMCRQCSTLFQLNKQFHFASSQCMRKIKPDDVDTGPKNIVKKLRNPILLYDSDESFVGKIEFSDATERAKLKDLKLVKIEHFSNESKETISTYKMMTGKQLHEAQMTMKFKKSEGKEKSEKQFMLKSNIQQNDFNIKLKNILENLSKGHSISVRLVQSKKGKSEGLTSLFKSITDEVKHAATLKTTKNTEQMMDFKLKPIDITEFNPANTEIKTSKLKDVKDMKKS